MSMQASPSFYENVHGSSQAKQLNQRHPIDHARHAATMQLVMFKSAHLKVRAMLSNIQHCSSSTQIAVASHLRRQGTVVVFRSHRNPVSIRRRCWWCNLPCYVKPSACATSLQDICGPTSRVLHLDVLRMFGPPRGCGSRRRKTTPALVTRAISTVGSGCFFAQAACNHLGIRLPNEARPCTTEARKLQQELRTICFPRDGMGCPTGAGHACVQSGSTYCGSSKSHQSSSSWPSHSTKLEPDPLGCCRLGTLLG